jgi:hypothetical protein
MTVLMGLDLMSRLKEEGPRRTDRPTDVIDSPMIRLPVIHAGGALVLGLARTPIVIVAIAIITAMDVIADGVRQKQIQSTELDELP